MDIYYEEYNKYQKYRQQINKCALKDLVIYDKMGNIIKLDNETKKEFEFTGLNPTDYIQSVYSTYPKTFVIEWED